MLAGCVERMFFYPDAVKYTTPSQIGVRVEDVHVVSSDGSRLHGWFMPAVGQAKATVLHLHGNAANISNHLPLVAWLPARGYNVLMIDYRGFGRSAGKPSLDGIVDDAAAALAYLRTRPDVDATRLIVFGQSIGGATALRMLARDANGDAACGYRFGLCELPRDGTRCNRGWSAGSGRCVDGGYVAGGR